jgi:type II secretory pathway pseudopilin PulG
LTLVELLLVITVIAIVIALAMPSFVASRKSANESAVVSSLRTVSSGQAVYSNRFGRFGTLDELVATGIVDETFQNTNRRGYVFANSIADPDSWSLNASPQSPGSSGDRYFFIDETGVIRFSYAGAAGSSDDAVQ